MFAQILDVIKINEICNIVAEQNGWGQLENGYWINLNFTVPVSYKVKDKESLWDIAEIYLGNGKRYLEIKSLNNLQSDILKPGMILKIPNK